MFDDDFDKYDEILGHLSQARERQERLYEDLVIAHHKGYGLSGGSAEEIQSEIDDLNESISLLEQEIDNWTW